jgi:hypothetical protein
MEDGGIPAQVISRVEHYGKGKMETQHEARKNHVMRETMRSQKRGEETIARKCNTLQTT